MAFAARLALVTLVMVTTVPSFALAAPIGAPNPDDGTLVSPSWGIARIAQAGLSLDSSIFGGSTWQVRNNTSLGATGTLYTLNNDIFINGDDVLLAGSFIYYSANPVLNYSFSVVDNGAPSSFGFMLTADITPGALGLHDLRVDFAAILNDGADANNTVGFTPLAPAVPVDGDGIPEAQVLTFHRPIDPAGTWINAGHDLGSTASLMAFGAVVEGPSLEQRNVNWNEWRFDLNFTGTGGGDRYAIAGRAQLTFIPVPAAAWLFASALVGGLTLVRRRA
ncbi:MAG TPA: hypothetical protein DCY89_09610 [Gammaproteobacteria bacterium]|nr:hypothetical protein [Gammaproteobacteria bacterium]